MIEILTSITLITSMVFGPVIASASVTPQATLPSAERVSLANISIVDGVALSAPLYVDNKVELEVRDYFEDTPILAEIAKCESQFTHVGKNGEIIRGMVNKSDIGVMQINTYYHAKEAKKAGLELKTLQGNMDYAKLLYEKEGSAPWKSSSHCWGKSQPALKELAKK